MEITLVILVLSERLVLSFHFLCSSLLIGSSKTDHKLLSHLATHNCICNHLNSTEVQLKFYTKIFNYWFFQQRPILHHELIFGDLKGFKSYQEMKKYDTLKG